jgi:hypothetical protein
MSEDSPQPHDRLPPEPDAPLAKLIADAVARIGSLRKAAAAVTDAAWHMDRKRTTVHPSTVADWLSGAIPHRSTRRWISSALEIPLDDLTRAAEAQRAPRDSALVDSDDVERREFTKLLLVAGTAAGSLDLERFASILAGTRADEPGLDDLETLTVDLIRRETTLAPHSLFPAVRGHLAGLRDVLVWTPPSLAPRAYSLAGQTALLAGYLMFKQDRHGEADVYWSLADRFGDMAGDVRLRAALLVLQAQRWEGENLPRQGDNLPLSLALLDRAASLLGPNPEPAAAAHVLTFRARRHAEASRADRAYAARSMHDIDSLHSHLSRMHSADASIYIVESVRGEAVQKGAMALLHLGRPNDAAADLERLLASIGQASLSWRSGVTTNLAASRAAMGESEHACDLLSASLQLATQASATRAVNRIRHARQQWLADYDGPPAARLDEQLLAI